jgi:hypothetical protein
VAGLELRCQISHLKWQVVFPELHGLLGAHGFVGSFGRSPPHAEGGTIKKDSSVWRSVTTASQRRVATQGSFATWRT